MATTQDFAPIVKAIVAEMSQSHSIADIRASETLQDLGISPDLVPELAIRLYRTVGGSGSGDYRDFSEFLSIGSGSSIKEVAAHFARALFAPVAGSGGAAAEPAGAVETAVLAAVAEISRMYSIGEIRPNHTLRQLGLEDSDIVDVKLRVYRMLSGPRSRPDFTAYFQGATLTGASTIGDAVELLGKAFPKVRTARAADIRE